MLKLNIYSYLVCINLLVFFNPLEVISLKALTIYMAVLSNNLKDFQGFYLGASGQAIIRAKEEKAVSICAKRVNKL